MNFFNWFFYSGWKRYSIWIALVVIVDACILLPEDGLTGIILNPHIPDWMLLLFSIFMLLIHFGLLYYLLTDWIIEK
jgi:hypothetical protein